MDLLQEKLTYLEFVLKMVGLFSNLEGVEKVGGWQRYTVRIGENSNSYDYGMLDLDFGNPRFVILMDILKRILLLIDIWKGY